MTLGLPNGWAKVPAAELFSFVTSGSRGWAAHYKDKGAKFIRVQNVSRGSVTLSLDDVQHVQPPDGVEGARTRLQAGDLTITITADLGRVGLVPDDIGEAYVNQHVALARPLDKRLAPFLAWFFSSSDAQEQMGLLDRGATRSGLGLKDIGAVEVCLPPLPEQRRIVAGIEALLARTRRARADLERTSVLLAHQQRAILTAAFKGNLTEDWRMRQASPKLPKHIGLWPIPASWSWRKVSDLGKVSLGRQRTPKDHAGPHMRHYVRAANIIWSGWKLSDVKQMNFDEAELERFRLVVGDVLLNEGSGSASEVGKPAIWQGQIKDCCFQNTLVRFQPKGCTSDYAYFYFLFSALTGAFAAETKGVNIHHIGKDGLAKFSIPVPELVEQKEITTRLRAMLAGLDRIVADQTRAAALLDRLDTAILARAVRGELVPQGPADEPASALLARLAAAHSPPSPKRRRAA